MPGGADAEPDPADPGGDAGHGGQLAHQLRQSRGHRLADIENAEARALPLRQLRGKPPGEAGGIAFGKGGGKWRAHDRPPISGATTGAMRSTSAATPRPFGWIPSGWLSSGRIATPSRKNG